MKVLVLGNNQFIINNFYSYVQNYKNISLFNAKSRSQLILQLKKSDIIILCFDLNKSVKIKNHLNQICKEIGSIKKKIPILYLSEYFDQNYLNIKLRAQENILLNLFNINKNPITIIRSPYIFGKWCNLSNSNLSKIICKKISKKSLLLKKKKERKNGLCRGFN